MTPPLTSVRVPIESLGATAVKALMARAADLEAVNVTRLLAAELNKRGSVRAYNSRNQV